jgi:hypothetical protein
MGVAEKAALLAAALFLITGLLTGVWKYLQIRRSSQARAHHYVDVAHRSSLLYAFACLVLERLAVESGWPEWIDLLAVLAAVIFFALAVGSYILHGALGDTANQFRRPHQLGSRELPAALMSAFMVMLIIAEIGGVTVLFAGMLRAWF